MPSKHTILVALLVIAAVFLVLGRNAVAQKRRGSENPGFAIVDAGSIPPTFGDFVAAVGDANNLGLLFRNSENEIYLIRFSGRKLPDHAIRFLRQP